MIPRRPLLAATIESPEDLKFLNFPIWISKKYDGIRAITTGSGVVSRTLKPIPNKFINFSLQELPAGIEGELCKLAKDFEDTESAVMSEEGEFDFSFHTFDSFSGNLFEPYKTRQNRLLRIYDDFEESIEQFFVIQQSICNNVEEIEWWFDLHVNKTKAEGIMIRDPNGFYKFGRSTLNEQLLIKYKPWNVDEAQVLDVLEEFENTNPSLSDERGYTKRSKHSANLHGKGVMGALLVKSKKFGEFKIGSGFTDESAKDIWDLWNYKLPSRKLQIQYRYRGLTKYGKPRHASFVRWMN